MESPDFDELQDLGNVFHLEDINYGVGLSPLNIYNNWNNNTLTSLSSKLRAIEDIGVEVISFQFDDMNGNVSDLAKRQSEIVSYVTERTNAKILFCPTYYSYDFALYKEFGGGFIPDGYFEDIGRLIPNGVEIIWTGPKIVSPKITIDHLVEVEETFRRKPFLWDNYPVNDADMTPYLHLRAIEGRPSNLLEHVSGYMANPMPQAYLSLIPLSTISDLLKNGKSYSPDESFWNAANEITSQPELMRFLVPILQDRGLRNLTSAQKEELIRKVLPYKKESWGKELIDTINGRYDIA